MTGEDVATRKQPGDRAPAPGQLALVQAFINTHYDLEHEHGAELLATPAALAAWLAGAGLSPQTGTGLRVETGAADNADLERALIVREGLRALARDGRFDAGLAAHLDRAALGAAVEVRFAGGPPRFVAARDTGTSGAIGVLLAVTAQSIADGTWSRLKVCPGEHCGWAFYDHSRNRSGRWCAMSVCGGRAKARSHYRRQRSRGL